MMIFDQPYWLSLLLLWPVAIWWWRKQSNRHASLTLSSSEGVGQRRSRRMQIIRFLPGFRHGALLLLVLAMARPQRQWTTQRVEGEGVDIMMALDISPSMLSRDFEPDRLTVSKQVAIDFVKKRPNDRIGLVVFSAEAFTHCPLTPDKRVVQQFIEEVSVGVLEDGTAIGLGLATALNRLKGSTARSKVVVLLTDGENTVPTVLPEDAAQIAVEMGVKVYTIGIGKEGLVESPVSRFPDGSYAFDIRRSVINTRLLESIAAMTGGRFYRAYSAADLSQIYDEIDQLEKTKVELTSYKRSTDYFQWLVGLAGILLLVAFLLQWFMVRTLTP
jgi:Ca-activated chloride channel family protein